MAGAGRRRATASVLSNGNLLIAHAKHAREYDARRRKVVWEYKLSEDNGELERATRLDNGRTMVVELGKKTADPGGGSKKGKVFVRVPLQPETDNQHMQTRMVRKLRNGNYLVPAPAGLCRSKSTIPAGKIVRTHAYRP